MKFGKKYVTQGELGKGDMNVYFYVAPSIQPSHKDAIYQAIMEFVNQTSGKKDWFKVSERPWTDVKDIVEQQPNNVCDLVDLHEIYYKDKLEQLHKNIKTPFTTIVALTDYNSPSNGAGTPSSKHTLVKDLMYINHLKSTVKHELGHRFGCGHCTGNCIMNPSGVGTHFCSNHLKTIQTTIADLYLKTRPKENKENTDITFTFGEPRKY